MTAAELREDTGTEPVDPDYPVTPVPAGARRGVVSISVVLIGFTIIAGAYFIMRNFFYAQGVVSIIIELVGGVVFLIVILRKGRL